MPILKARHNLEGEVFVIKMHTKITRKFLGVHFVDGQGVTKFEERAKRFDEEFGYDVQLPKGHKGWVKAEKAAVPVEELEETSGLEEDELEED